MTTTQMDYPFAPKSRAHLRSGQYWPIQLSTGRFAAGIVVSVPEQTEAPLLPTRSKNFIAGVLDWSGDSAPITDDLHGAQLLDWGAAHVKMITLDGTLIEGETDQTLNRIPMLSHRTGGDVWVYANGIQTGLATERELKDLRVMSVWGFAVARGRAERHFVEGVDLRKAGTD